MFFGRKDIVAKFENGMRVGGSHYKTLFITGVRGTGKTTLLEHLSQMARDADLKTVDAVYSNATRKLFKALSGHDETAVSDGVQAGVQVMGSGASVKLGGTTVTDRATAADLDDLMRAECDRNGKGLLLTIDEIQKVRQSDLEEICGAFLLASRKGSNVMLAVAGLPGSYEKVSKYKGCTYIRRSVHEQIGLFTQQEVVEALKEAFDDIELLEVDDSVARYAADLSKGQPYLMQLLCFHLIELLNSRPESARQAIGREPYRVTKGDFDAAFQESMGEYEQGALGPIVDEIPDSERRYLVAAAKVLDEDRVAKSRDIGNELGIKEPNELSAARQRLINREIIVPSGFGEVAFAIPYLADYLLSGAGEPPQAATARAWRL